MAKAVSLTASDLNAEKPRQQSTTLPRGAKPSEKNIPLQFVVSPEFAREFKQAALDRDMKLTELFKACFHEFMK